MCKRFIVVFLTVMLLTSAFCSCGKGETKDTTAADTYLSMAESFIEQGDYDEAWSILQKGFDETKDSRIAVKIAELSSDSTGTTADTADTEEVPSKGSVEDFVGVWAEPGINSDNGGLIIDVECAQDTLTIFLSYTQSAPASRTAEFGITESLDNIKNNIVACEGIKDSWGNTVTAEIDFSDPDSIECRIVKVIPDEYAMWGFKEATYRLVRNDDAHQQMEYAPGNVENIEIYDTSKASGILASLGMTEEEFKNSCIPTVVNWIARNDEEYSEAYGRQYYQDHPDDQEFQNWIARWNETDPSAYPKTKYSSMEDYFSDMNFYGAKGVDILHENTYELFSKMREYPNDYIGQGVLILDMDSFYCDISNTGVDISINDVRDNPNNPNIVFSQYDYHMYVIFKGSNGGTLYFDMITFEKVAE